MAIRKLILHVGMCKTGTSSIQASLSVPENKAILRQEGVYFLDELGANQSTSLYNMFNRAGPETYSINHALGYSTEDVLRMNAEYFRITEQVVASAPEETLLLSAESLSSIPEGEFSDLRDYFLSLGIQEIQVLLYVRQPVDYYISFAQTNARMGYPRHESNRPGPENELHFYQHTIERLKRVFPAEQLSIFSFDEALREFGNPVAHFLHVLGVRDEAASRVSIQKTNESLAQEVVDFFIYFNTKLPCFLYSDKNRKIGPNPERGAYDFHSFLKIKGRKYTFPSAEKKELAEAVLHDTEWLQEHTGINYVDSVHAILAEKPEPIPASPPETYGAFLQAFASLNDPSRALFLDFLETVRATSTAWEDLYQRCRIQSEYGNLPFPEKVSPLKKLLGQERIRADEAGTKLRVAQIYYGTNRKFTENHSLIYPIQENPVEITHTFESGEGIRHIRFDPADFACCIYLQEISFGVPYEILSGNWVYRERDMFLFLTHDPQIFIRTQGNAQQVKLRFYIDPYQSPFSTVSGHHFLKILETR